MSGLLDNIGRMIDFERTLQIGEEWRQSQDAPRRSDNTDRVLTAIAILFFAQALPLVVALWTTGGC